MRRNERERRKAKAEFAVASRSLHLQDASEVVKQAIVTELHPLVEPYSNFGKGTKLVAKAQQYPSGRIRLHLLNETIAASALLLSST